MQKSPLISIVMPVKNAAPFLKECLDSIINQSESNWELIAVNDHSTDASFSILSNYSEQDQRIRFFENEGDGIIAALQLAYKNAKGDLITRMDADDVMAENKLLELKSLLEKNGEGSIATGFVKYISETELGDGYKKYESWLNGLTFSQINFTQIYKECVIPSPCWMTWKNDLEKCGDFNNNTYPEDYDLCFRFYKHGLKVVSAKKTLHFWRDHPERSSRTQEHYSQQNYFDLKIPYFLELESAREKDLMVLGAGSKGKLLAQKLIDLKVEFKWLTNNPKKIGHDIYGKILQSQSALFKSNNPLVMVSISSPGDLKELRKLFKMEGFRCGEEYHLFF